MTTEVIEQRILKAFTSAEVFVIDANGVGDHFEVRLSAPDLENLSRIERHQKVMELFKEELASGEIHALSIKYIS